MLTGRTNREGEWRKQEVERSANCWSNVLGVNEEVSEPLYRSKDSPQLIAKTTHPWKPEKKAEETTHTCRWAFAVAKADLFRLLLFSQ